MDALPPRRAIFCHLFSGPSGRPCRRETSLPPACGYCWEMTACYLGRSIGSSRRPDALGPCLMQGLELENPGVDGALQHLILTRSIGTSLVWPACQGYQTTRVTIMEIPELHPARALPRAAMVGTGVSAMQTGRSGSRASRGPKHAGRGGNDASEVDCVNLKSRGPWPSTASRVPGLRP